MATKADGPGLFGRLPTKWLVVLASFLVLFVVKGTVATYGVFIAPIEADFGWSRTTVSLTFSIYLVATAVASPVSGRLIDSYGAHRTFPVFIALVALPLVALSLISSVAHLYALYALIGVAITGLANSHVSAIVTKWFDGRALLASGVAISGFSLGQLVFNPVAAELILTRDWRFAYLAFGALSLATIPLAYLFVRNPGDWRRSAPDADGAAAADADVGAEAEAEAGAGTRTGPEIALPSALRSRSLWLLVVTFFICGFTTVGLMTTHFVPYLLSVGFAESVAAQAAGVLGGMTVLGLLAMGAVGDRYQARKRHLLAGIYLLRGVTLYFLLLVSSVVEVFAFATVYGFLTLCTVPLHAGITADRFGSEHLTTLIGVQYAGHQFGGASAALLAGWIFDAAGSYRWAHLLGVGMLLVAPVLVLVDRADPAVAG